MHEQQTSYSAWTWTVAFIIALALLLLFITGRGPTAACCSHGAETALATGAPAVMDEQMSEQLGTLESGSDAATALPETAKIYFEVGQTNLPASATSVLAPTIAWLNANDASKAIVSGFHDETGGHEINQKIAKARAKAVYNALVSEGVDSARIEMRKPQVTTGTGDLAEARRVEVIVE